MQFITRLGRTGKGIAGILRTRQESSPFFYLRSYIYQYGAALPLTAKLQKIITPAPWGPCQYLFGPHKITDNPSNRPRGAAPYAFLNANHFRNALKAARQFFANRTELGSVRKVLPHRA